MPSPRTSKKTAAATLDTPATPAPESVDTGFLRTLVGYNARRASLAVIEVFMERMAVYRLKVVDFSVLSLVAHNPGVTSRQLCVTQGELPPNLVGLIAALERRGLIERRPHPS
ncbi:helix-turn-helix domain-containing protein, partial [Acidovorax sp.]|uniref:MarR family winged helix-turn-helix transcriptional regulator n=1 Tax=Acidovorax sp. TaxID=1872122 RepID=UPI0025BDBE60